MNWWQKLGRQPESLGVETAVMRGVAPPSVQRVNRYLHIHRLHSLLPYESYGEATGVYFNGELGHGIVVECLPATGANDTVVRILSNLYKQAMPVGTGIQFVLWASPNILPQLAGWAGARQDAAHQEGTADSARPNERRARGIYRTLARRRIEYLLAGTRRPLFGDNPVILRNFRLMVSVLFPGRGNEYSLQRLLSLRSGLMSTLRTAGLPARALGVDDFLMFMEGILNPGFERRAPLRWDPSRALKQQIVHGNTRMLVDKDSLVLNDCNVLAYSATNYPAHWSLGQMGDLLGDSLQPALQIPCPFLLTLNTTVMDQDKIKNMAAIKSARATQNANGPLGKVLPELADKKKDWDLMMCALDQGQGATGLSHQLILLPQLGQADIADQLAKSLYSSRSWELQRDGGVQVQSLLAALPLTLSMPLATELKATGKVTTKTTFNAINMAPLVGEWGGNHVPRLLLFGPRGQLHFLDIFEKMGSGGNFNTAIAARSGSGKSVLMQEVVSTYVGTGNRAWVIDVGRSYERTCKLCGGEFIEITQRSGVCLNPFTRLDDQDSEAFNDQINEIKPIIAQMAAPSRKTDDLENAWIEQGILDAWRQHRQGATVTAVAAWLQRHEHPRARELGQMLFPYTREGIHGPFFEGSFNLRLDNAYIVLELEELKGKKDLQEVVLLTLMNAVNQSIYLQRMDGRMKLLVVDEAWDLFSGDSSAKFVENAARRIRKYGGSLITATQGVDDYYKTLAAKAAFDNSDWLILMAQKKESIEQLERSGRLSMDPIMKRGMESLRTVRGQYADLMIVGPQGCSVGRLILDPYSQCLYSTNNEDFIALKRMEQQGISITDAVDELVKRKRELNL